MKRFFTYILLFVALLSAICMAAKQKNGKSVMETESLLGNWISELPDSIPVCELSLPGAHDACTGEGTKFNLARTQELSLQQLWDIGVRVFDFRPRVYKGELHIFHGPLPTKISWEEAVDVLFANLKMSPGEFAIVIFQDEGGHKHENREKWDKLMKDYFLDSLKLPENILADFRPDLTVGDLRGKILFLSRTPYAKEPPTGGFISGWNFSPDGTTEACISGKEEAACLAVQDYFSPRDMSSKVQSVLTMADYAVGAERNVWVINHASAYVGSSVWSKSYARSAASVHAALLNQLHTYENSRGLGIVMMDFAGVDKWGKQQTLGDTLFKELVLSNFFRLSAKSVP